MRISEVVGAAVVAGVVVDCVVVTTLVVASVVVGATMVICYKICQSSSRISKFSTAALKRKTN